jgi:hypothetical protein
MRKIVGDELSFLGNGEDTLLLTGAVLTTGSLSKLMDYVFAPSFLSPTTNITQASVLPMLSFDVATSSALSAGGVFTPHSWLAGFANPASIGMLGGGGMRTSSASSDIGLENTTLISLDNMTSAGSRFVMPGAKNGSADTASTFPNMATSNEGFSTDASSAPSPGLTKSFAGPTKSQSFSDTNHVFIPPDPSIAAGPNNIVVTVNDTIAWYDKNGTQQGLTSLDAFFGDTDALSDGSADLFDPRVIYDQYSGHFYALADLRDSTNQIARIYVAESNTSDATQGWKTVFFSDRLTSGTTNFWGDYPTLAVDQNGLYITVNLGSLSDEEEDAPLPDGVAGGSSSRLFMLTKDISTFYTYDPGAAVSLDGLTLQPAHTYGNQSGAGLTGSFLLAYQQNNSGNDTLNVVRINNAISDGSTFSKTALNVGDISDVALAGNENFAPQLGSTTGLNVGDDRIYSAVWRDGILYATTEIVVSGRAMVHWFEVNTSTMTLIDQGNISADDLGAGTNTYYGNITVNSSGQFTVGFSASNSNIFAGAYYAIRSPGDPAGTLEGTQALQVGQNSYFALDQFGRNRWGDYSGAAVDPSDDKSFWFFNEYASSTQNQWATRTGEVVSDTIAPSLVHEGSITLAIGATATIPSSQLQFDDNVSTHAQETYSIVTAPAHGTLLKSGSATSSFTQADIDNGLISYHEDGSVASSDSFVFKVTDAAGNQTTAQQFQFQISPRPDSTAPSLIHDNALTVALNGTSTITSSVLQFDDNTSTHAQEIYTIVTAPAHGTLLKSGAATSSFTQADIDNGLISYHEDGSLASSDSFAFKVTDAAGNATSTTSFQVNIGPLFAAATFQLAAFAPAAGGWNSDTTYPRELADVNKDGFADIVGFGQSGVYVALGTGNGSFGTPSFKLAAFAPDAGGWNNDDRYPRELADVNKDGFADIVGFGESGVYVALGTGNGSFGTPSFKLAAFAPGAGGWNSETTYPRELADVNNDGMADIVGFGQDGVYVALATGGGSFGPSSFKLANFAPGAGGWSNNDKFPRFLADVNGDHMADIVGFGQDGVYVALATGGGSFGPSSFKLANFAPSAGGWINQTNYPRELADVNNDGMADIVGFGQDGVYVALASGGGNFGPSSFQLANFAPGAGGWNSDTLYPRHLADLNHDGAADIVGFGQSGVYDALNGFHLT